MGAEPHTAAEQRLTQAGIPFRRITHPEGLPMHNKFVLAEKAGPTMGDIRQL